MKKKADIVLIDSGINYGKDNLKSEVVGGCTLVLDEDFSVIENEFYDEEGHGTAVFSIFDRKCEEASYYIIKLEQDEEGNISSRLLQYALEYIDSNVECTFIHMSLGVEICSHIHEFEKICDILTHKGVIIIAAFSNMGCVSYPAAFDCVIGVDEVKERRHFNEFEYIENSIVNIRTAATAQMIPWENEKNIKVSGTSFSSPHITIFLYNHFKNKTFELDDAKKYLKDNAYKMRICEKYNNMVKCFSIKKAIVFPFNKEIHSLVRFSQELSFRISGIFDTKYMGNVGKRVSEIMDTDLVQDFWVENVDEINWKDDFDTLIIGHTKLLEEYTKKEYVKYLLDMCKEYNKKAYIFDTHAICANDYKNIYIPKITNDNIPHYLLGKLFCISVPVLCIIGTSSRQGKFTIQNVLRKKFKACGYKVGQLGTEPTSPLLGFDAVYPMGYESTVEVQGCDCVAIVNKMLHDIEMTGPDIIIAGTQSQTAAAGIACTDNIPRDILYFLYGINPDGFILVCNYFDPLDYVVRTIKFAESINGSDVIAVVVFPMDNDMRWSVLGNKKKIVDVDKLYAKKKEIHEASGKNVYILGDESEMTVLYNEILSFFQSGGC